MIFLSLRNLRVFFFFMDLKMNFSFLWSRKPEVCPGSIQASNASIKTTGLPRPWVSQWPAENKPLNGQGGQKGGWINTAGPENLQLIFMPFQNPFCEKKKPLEETSKKKMREKENCKGKIETIKAEMCAKWKDQVDSPEEANWRKKKI